MDWIVKENKLTFLFLDNDFVKSFLNYKIRIMFGLGNYFYLPRDYKITNNSLSLEFDINLSENAHIDNEIAKKNLFALFSKGIFDLSSYVIKNKFIPDVKFFLPINKQSPNLLDLFTLFKFTLEEKEAVIKRDKGYFESKKHNTSLKKISPFDLVLFAELLFDRLLIYSFDNTNNGKKLLIKKTDKNKLFPSFRLPTVQELWDSFVETNKVIPQLSFWGDSNIDIFEEYDYNNKKISNKYSWIYTHQDKQIIEIDKPIKEKSIRYFSPVDIGTKILSQRKQYFTEFFTGSTHFTNLISGHYKRTNNKITRNNLPKVIAENKGIFLVQGPPGTGKTYLASQVIEQTLIENENARILIVAKEHLALNHLLEVSLKRLEDKGLKHYAVRILDSSKYNIYASEIEDFDVLLSEQILKLKKEEWLEKYSNWEIRFNRNSSRYDIRLKKLIIESANLIFVTSMDREWKRIINNNELLDLVIIEEASKAYPSELFHAVASGINVLLIGDQQQLPPFQLNEALNFITDIKNIVVNDIDTTKSIFNEFFKNVREAYNSDEKLFNEAKKWTEPFATLYAKFPDSQKFLLNEEYRLENELTKIISDTFYNGKLLPKKNTSSKYQKILPDKINKKLLWIDTPHIIENEDAGEDPERTGRRINLYEIDQIIKYFKCLENSNISKEENDSIVILTPYNEQKKIIIANKELNRIVNKTCKYKLKDIVKTVDEFQGHEAEITLISLVRNNVLNSNNAWGFISSPERLNVMFSRAKYSLVIIGSTKHIIRNNTEKNSYLLEFLNNFKKYGHFIKAEIF